ncbi:hypothetical protein [Luteimonas sp. gir]|uniref:hypothetical protein n=1 Tax=Luteimonas sp. gir TaxID=3127960 RepID=UPI003075BE67
MTTQRMVAGVTLDQVDRLDHLLQSITALGDVLAMGDVPLLQEHTVSTLGHAVFRAGLEAQEILDTVGAQRLGMNVTVDPVASCDVDSRKSRSVKENELRRRLSEARTREELERVLEDSYFDRIRQVLADGPGGPVKDDD